MRPGASHVHLFGLRVPEQLASEAQSKREQYSLACSVRLLPLKTPQEVLGVLCVLIADDSQLLLIDTDLNIGNGQPSAQAVFLRVFLEQAVALIERGRLQHESLRIKVLQETDTLRAALLSSVSHDLRTPLSAIMTAATSLQHVDAQWDDEERQSQAQLIEHEAKRLNRLVENLLDMSRIEGGALRPNKMLYPLDELIRDVLGRLYLLLQSRPLQLSLPADLPPVELDYMQIDQVVTNLLENVARYTPAGSAIDIELLSQREWIEVRIADRGPGIALNEREQIFDKFYRVLGGKSRGSGLGLTVCQGLIEAHGGHIWVEPRDEGGAVFCFTLPQSTMEIKEQ
jgi:two-component system, OmpR family, sensor histidine kinase KdpD